MIHKPWHWTALAALVAGTVWLGGCGAPMQPGVARETAQSDLRAAPGGGGSAPGNTDAVAGSDARSGAPALGAGSDGTNASAGANAAAVGRGASEIAPAPGGGAKPPAPARPSVPAAAPAPDTPVSIPATPPGEPGPPAPEVRPVPGIMPVPGSGLLPQPVPSPTIPAPVVGGDVQVLSSTQLSRGQYSGLDTQQVLLVTSQSQWQQVWAEHGARQVPPPPLPAVDFDREAVLVVALGEQRSGGYGVEVTGLRLAGDQVEATLKVTRPGPGTMVTMALTQPYQMLRIPRPGAGMQVKALWQ